MDIELFQNELNCLLNKFNLELMNIEYGTEHDLYSQGGMVNDVLVHKKNTSQLTVQVNAISKK